MGNSAPAGIRRDVANQPSRKQRGRRARHQDEQKTREPLLLGPRNQVVAPLVCMLERKPEERPYRTCSRPHEQGERSKHKQAAVALSGLRRAGRVQVHSQTYHFFRPTQTVRNGGGPNNMPSVFFQHEGLSCHVRRRRMLT